MKIKELIHIKQMPGSFDVQSRRSEPGVIIVRPEEPAADVARNVDEGKIKTIIVEDESGSVQGLIQTQRLTDAVAELSTSKVVTMSDAAMEIASIGTHRVLAVLERPSDFWCEDGSHFNDLPYCSEHDCICESLKDSDVLG
ncbi:MAG: hypothetical protein PVG03_17085 [Desulfarculaceae bacterium]|jgi:hypothetical protein